MPIGGRHRAKYGSHGDRVGPCGSFRLVWVPRSKMRKVLNRILDRAGLHRRGPHQMRHTSASLLFQAGVAITCVSHQLRHRDSAISLRVYAYWLPDTGTDRSLDRLDTDASRRNLYATTVADAGAMNPRKLLKKNGAPPWTRTPNPQIKSLVQ